MSEKQSYNQINEQESSAYMSRRGDKPTVLIKRTSGNITVGRLDKDTRKVLFSEDGEGFEKRVALESLSDARQEVLAAELAGRALRGVVESDSTVEVGASSVESSELDKLLEKVPVLKNFQQEIKVIADLRKRENADVPRHGMNPHDASERMIDNLIALMAQVQKPRSLSEDRRGAIYRAIDLE